MLQNFSSILNGSRILAHSINNIKATNKYNIRRTQYKNEGDKKLNRWRDLVRSCILWSLLIFY